MNPSARRRLLGALTTVGTIVVVLLAWQIGIAASGLSPYIAKTPLDVVRYLMVDDPTLSIPSAAVRRLQLLALLGVTLRHAAIGLGIGTGLGMIGSFLLAASSTLRTMFLPIAIFLQTIPLIAIAPVIYAVFGSGIATVAVICGMVTFFPLLVNLITGLRAGSRQVEDVVTVFGGGRLALLRHVAIPSALPYFFAGLKIAAPATIGGAMLYEYLFTFQGLGAAMLTSKNYSQYAFMWTIVAVSVLVSLVVYGLVVLLERAVLARRYPPAAER